MASAKPSKPPAADLSALVNRVDQLSVKAGLGPLGLGAKKLPLWKRWIGGDKPEYNTVEAGGIRTVVDANAKYLDAVKGDLDSFRENNGVAHNSFNQRLALLEAQATVPFPGST